MLELRGGSPPPRRNQVARAIGFARPWAFGAARVAYLFSVGWLKWKNRASIVEICRHFGYNYDARETPELPPVPVSVLVSSDALLDVREIDAVDGNVTERELITICRLTRAAGPKTILEIGTFDGRTTLNLATNSPPDARVYTLDLPKDSIGSSASEIDPVELKYADKSQSGSRYAGTDAERKIEQLYGDSGTFDFSPFYGQVDFVFIDGSHTYEYVINDSLHALRLLNARRGTIVWHDYSRWDGVTRALNELRRLEPACSAMKWIEGTTLAVLTR